MEFNWQSPSVKKSGFTIGFLDENLANDFSCQMMPGVFEAARKYRINIVRFAYYPYHFAYDYHHQVKMIFDLIDQFNLDGLLFLGWTRAGALHNYNEFTARFKSIPVLSIGTGFTDTPHVYTPGNVLIREIILHFIDTHHYNKIAYIAPMIPDNRNETYRDTMKEYGIYDSELYISEQDLDGVPFSDRATRALAILLDERKVQLDAIMSMYAEETTAILSELAHRGLRVPYDIALTSYEERYSTKYTSPELTTVYFPWVELGFCGCTKLAELLSEGHIPLSTAVPGKVIYRESCGCLSRSVTLAGRYRVENSGSTLETITVLEQQKIVAEMEMEFPYGEFNFKTLLAAFLEDFKNHSNIIFLVELGSQLRKLTYIYHQSNLEDMISTFRGLLLPYLTTDPDILLWSGDLFQQAQVMAWEKITNVYSSTKVTAKILNQNLQEISQTLITSISTESLMDSLAKNLYKLKIPSCYIFICNSLIGFDRVQNDLLNDCMLAFAYSGNKRCNDVSNKKITLTQVLSEIITGDEQPSAILAHLLHITNEFIGFVLFEPGPMDQMLYQTLAAHLSIALRSTLLIEKLDASYLKLAEQAHREGMADISAEILHNIGNILNSINISVNLMKGAADSLLIPYLLKANELLASNIADLENFICHDPKGKTLMQFYIKLGMSFTEFKDQMLYHSNRLDDKINSIVTMITAQQNYAGVKESPEKLDIASVMDDTIKLMAESLDKYHIKITKNYQTRPKIAVQKMKLFHILLNIINNAKEALMETIVNERNLIIAIDEDNQGKYIRINDNGSGIPSHLLEKIFEFGYINQESGQELGLYSCSKYMAEMGGKIWAESEGPGKGATFILQFN